MKKELEKYLLGSSVKDYIKTPNEVLTENQINLAKAKQEAETSPIALSLELFSALSSQLGGDAMKLAPMLMGLGGVTKKKEIEVEGGEVAETPSGEIKEYRGKNHEQGGIKTTEEVGTEIFSKRLKIDGKSLAKRKLDREKKLNKLFKLFEKTKNSVDKSTYELVKKQFEEEELKDIKLQEITNLLYKKGNNKFKFGTGKPVGIEKYWERLLNDTIPEVEPLPGIKLKSITPSVERDLPNPLTNILENNKDKENISNAFKQKNQNLTAGDMIGIGGQLFSSISSYLTTLKDRATDTPNVNYYKNYGEEGLQDMENSRNNLIKLFELAKTRADKQRNSVIDNNRNNSRSINTLRALNLFSDLKLNDFESQLFEKLLGTRVNMDSVIAQMKNKRDLAKMQGEEKRDIADRMDKSNYYTQLRTSLENLGFGIQNIGKSLNEAKYRNTSLKDLETYKDNTEDLLKLAEIINLLNFQEQKNTEKNE